MDVKDITNDYIKNNFDIEAHRKEKNASDKIGEIEPLCGSYTLDEFFDKIRDDFHSITQRHNDNIDFSQKMNITGVTYKIKCDMVREDEPHPFFEGDSGTSMEVVAEVTRQETEKEVISRLKGRERQKIKDQKQRQRDKAQKEQKLKEMADELGYEVKAPNNESNR